MCKSITYCSKCSVCHSTLCNCWELCRPVCYNDHMVWCNKCGEIQCEVLDKKFGCVCERIVIDEIDQDGCDPPIIIYENMTHLTYNTKFLKKQTEKESNKILQIQQEIEVLIESIHTNNSKLTNKINGDFIVSFDKPNFKDIDLSKDKEGEYFHHLEYYLKMKSLEGHMINHKNYLNEKVSLQIKLIESHLKFKLGGEKYKKLLDKNIK